MLMSGDAATGQSGSPLDALDLQGQIPLPATLRPVLS
jgi:hypothetical protein